MQEYTWVTHIIQVFPTIFIQITAKRHAHVGAIFIHSHVTGIGGKAIPVNHGVESSVKVDSGNRNIIPTFGGYNKRFGKA
ncbi:hypothetical protein DSECCO2_646650 [anaerobic digester metagenome]